MSTNEQFADVIETIKSAKCCVCHRVLSVPPVVIIGGDHEGLKNRCGRCTNTNTKILIRNTTFENAAKFLSFPCIYKKCTQEIPWKFVREHETTCQFRSIRCPSYDNCCVEVEVSKLETHFTETHRDNIRHDKIEIPCFLLCDDVFLMIVRSQQYLVRLLNRSDIFYVYVSSVQNYGEVAYNVELSSDAVPGLSVSLKNSNVYKYDENKHCLNCEFSICGLQNHENKIHNVIPGCCVKKSAVSSLLQIPSGDKCTVTVSIKKASGGLKRDLERSERLRACFECPICNMYMTSRMSTCRMGHTICEGCKKMVKSCPICKSEISGRNYALEDVARLVDLTCCNDDIGCDFSGNVSDVVKHENDCFL